MFDRQLIVGYLSPLLAMLALPLVSWAEPLSGEQIYQQKCAGCHGPKGEGVEDAFPEPLVGDKSIGELAALIEKTMPEESPEDCVGDEAAKVAAYIHEAFYSPTAQVRNKPARVELSRLTVRQYRNAVADLVGSFRSPPGKETEKGLRGEYFPTRRYRNEDRKLDRIDPTIAFQFGESSPAPDKLGAEEFSIRWQGSVVAPETGEYELVIKTENGARLWVNDNKNALIDAWVKSGNDTEYRETIFLLGGRAYSLRLEFFKSKRDKTASVALHWKQPHRAEELIAERHLSPSRPPELFVCSTSFPPDDRSVGYERGTSVSKAWEQATTDGAIEVAGYIAARLPELAGVQDSTPDREARLREFCLRLAERAFRHPLSSEEKHLYIERQFLQASDLETAVKRVVLLVLKSPRFLYQELHTQPDSFVVASRLSFGLWDSLPDQELWNAAAADQLATREQVARQAERMAKDPRAEAKLREFLLQWLKVDHLGDLSKDTEAYPEFTPEVISDLRTSLDLSLDELISSDTADFRQLLLADSLYLNGRLAKLYGGGLAEDAGFQKAPLDPEARAGVLSHPYLMAGFAYTATSSPIHRGVFVSRSLLGRSLRAPPEAVAPLAPELHAELTTRERVILQTSPAMCQSCHTMINPLGFTLEHFDAIGRFRKEERGKPVDASGSYLTRSGETVKFSGVRELATFLAQSNETHAAFAEQLFQYLIKQPVQAYGPEQLPALTQAFAASEFNIRRLMAEIVTAAALQAPATRP